MSGMSRTLTLDGAKSLSNRALLLAALAHGQSTLRHLSPSDDTQAMLAALQTLGIDIQLSAPRSAEVTGCQGRLPNTTANLDCHAAGSVARFLSALCASQNGCFTLQGTSQLTQRPMQPLLNCLRQLGATIQGDHLPLNIQGRRLSTTNTLQIDTQLSSQFLSALMMIAPLTARGLHFKHDLAEEKPYVRMTQAMMAHFGITTISHDEGINIPHDQYLACDLTIEPDAASASYFLAAAALLNTELILLNAPIQDSMQGEWAFIHALQTMGCVIKRQTNRLYCHGTSQLQGITINMKNYSDTFMSLAVLAPFANRPTTIFGLKHTRAQECDRITVVVENLTRLGIRCECADDWLRIFPGTICPTQITCHGDHRIAMAFALLRFKCPQITLDDTQCVAKSCPDYFSHLANTYATLWPL